jgi:uncharacterized protein involved in exopolysaccharide biosynthesis
MPIKLIRHPIVRLLKTPLIYAFSAAAIMALATLPLSNIYMSEIRILPGDTRNTASGLAQLAAAAAAVGVAMPGQETNDSAFLNILSSRWMKVQLLQSTYRFKARLWRFGAEREHEQTLLAFLKADNLDTGVEGIRDLLSITTDPKTRLLTIQVMTKSPSLSQAVAKRTLALLEEFALRRVQNRGRNKAHFASERLKEAATSLGQVEHEYQGFWSENRNYTQSQDPAVRLRGAHFEADLKLKQQVLAALTLSYEQAIVDEKNDMPILNVLDDGNLPIEKSGPRRSIYIAVSFFLVGLSRLVYQHRDKLNSLFADATD